jgi:Holliday junction resolvase RusA-like endonuclease
MIFQVIGKPRGKARPRFDGRHKRTFTPASTADYERLVRQAYISSGGYLLSETAPIKILIVAQFKKAVSSKKEAPTMKPDNDNIEKAVCDALNGIAYRDDSQIVHSEVMKVWARDGVPKIIVKIEVENEQCL